MIVTINSVHHSTDILKSMATTKTVQAKKAAKKIDISQSYLPTKFNFPGYTIDLYKITISYKDRPRYTPKSNSLGIK